MAPGMHYFHVNPDDDDNDQDRHSKDDRRTPLNGRE